MLKKIPMIVSILIGICMLVGAMWAFDSTYTRASYTQYVEAKADRRFLAIDAKELRNRMWQLQKFYGEEEAKRLEEYKELEYERDLLLKELQR